MYDYRAEVLRVVDGDTVDVVIDLGFDIQHKGRVRLAGIDAPETRTKDDAEKERGLAAKAYVEEFLKDADVILISKEFNRGKFGRILGELEVNGRNLNLSMVREGHAVEYHGSKRK